MELYNRHAFETFDDNRDGCFRESIIKGLLQSTE